MQDIQQVPYRMLSNAQTPFDLRIPPANRLEKLVGDRAGQYSIRIHDLGTSPQFWLGLQTDYDLDKALDRLESGAYR